MPGTALNLDLPNVGDTMSVMVAKTKAALSAIQDDLTPKIVSSELNINAGLSFNGNALTGLGYATLVSGNVPAAAGSIYYNNGEFYAVDGTGVVKLTNLGTIAIAGVKGIGGDYGNIANSALVYYDNVSGEYRFYAGNGVAPGNLVGGYVTVNNGTHKVVIQPSAVTTDYTLKLLAALPGATSLLQIDNTGAMTASNTIPVPTTTDYKWSAVRDVPVPLQPLTVLSNLTYTTADISITSSSTNWDGKTIVLSEIRPGDRIVSATTSSTFTGTMQLRIDKISGGSAASTGCTIAVVSGTNQSANFTSSYTLLAGEAVYIDISGSATGAVLKQLTLKIDRP